MSLAPHWNCLFVLYGKALERRPDDHIARITQWKQARRTAYYITLLALITYSVPPPPIFRGNNWQLSIQGYMYVHAHVHCMFNFWAFKNHHEKRLSKVVYNLWIVIIQLMYSHLGSFANLCKYMHITRWIIMKQQTFISIFFSFNFSGALDWRNALICKKRQGKDFQLTPILHLLVRCTVNNIISNGMDWTGLDRTARPPARPPARHLNIETQTWKGVGCMFSNNLLIWWD